MEMNKESFREEVKKFRSSFKSDASDTAEKSIRLEKRGAVAVIVFDQHQERANKLSTPNMLRLFDLMLEIEKDSAIGAMVLISKKPSIFIAGADISEIQKLSSGQGTAADLMKLQSVFTYLERMAIPSIAAIHGACMGGGTEMSLACDYRVMTDAPETRMALPEVMLGVIPGWGGTQRMPKLLGLEKSLDLILTGKAVDGRKAKKIGLADKVMPKEWLEEKVMSWANELAKTKVKNPKHADLKDRLLEAVPGGKWVIFEQAKKAVLSKTKGNYPAPLKALEVIKKTYGGDLEAGLKVEAEAFAELVVTEQSKHLIELYYLNEKVKKDKGTTAGVKGQEVHQTAVVGAGVMGGGIAQLFAQKGARVRLKDVQWDAVGKGTQAAYKIFKKQVERKKMKRSDLDNTMARIEGTVEYSGFKHLDLVVEAVVEDMKIKKLVFNDLETNCGPKTILATNTSSLSVTEIASDLKDPSRVVGMHFFNPVDKMPLVEVIRGQKTSDEAIATVFQYAKKIGKTPIVVKDAPGFVVNRILGPYMNEAAIMMAEGAGVHSIDAAMESFGMPMGPITLLDEVGLDVAAKVSKVLYGAFGERMKSPPLFEAISAEKRLGKKSGKGIFLWEDSGKKKTLDTEFLQKLGIKDGSVSLSEEEIQKRLLYLMINEAARCWEEGLVRQVSDIDVGMIFGTGFAPFRGGLLRYADSVGADHIVSDLEVFTRKYGPRFQSSQFLQHLAVDNKKFYGVADK